MESTIGTMQVLTTKWLWFCKAILGQYDFLYGKTSNVVQLLERTQS